MTDVSAGFGPGAKKDGCFRRLLRWPHTTKAGFQVGRRLKRYNDKNIYIHITWNQCDLVERMEGEEASLCLKSTSDCAVFAS